MNKKEQIKELQRYAGMACEMYDSRACCYDDCAICSIAGDIAHKIYDAGYRKTEKADAVRKEMLKECIASNKVVEEITQKKVAAEIIERVREKYRRTNFLTDSWFDYLAKEFGVEVEK